MVGGNTYHGGAPGTSLCVVGGAGSVGVAFILEGEDTEMSSGGVTFRISRGCQKICNASLR